MAAGFSFQGTELIGVAAGESENPRENVPRAIRQVFWRILIFLYFGDYGYQFDYPVYSPEPAQR